MPRKKVEIKEAEEPKEAPEPKEAKKPIIEVVAGYKLRSLQGDRVEYRYVGKGETPAEALNLVCESPEEDEGKPFPKGCNVLVNVKVKKGDYKFNRALAPHVSRDILEHKNVALFVKLLGL